VSAIDELWARTRAEISSVAPDRAAALQRNGALLVDTRPVAQRQQFGEIADALIVERNVLEWRLDPSCPHHHALVVDPGQAIVVFCQEGYSSVLAVSSLARLGLSNVHDLAGGFEAWAAAGLPTTASASAATEGPG
jgi:rhodanese-related sulfurtransferase